VGHAILQTGFWLHQKWISTLRFCSQFLIRLGYNTAQWRTRETSGYGVLAKKLTGNHQALDLVRTLKNLVCLGVTHVFLH
jgi:hypothetical protein